MAAAVWSQLAADAGNLALVQRGEEVAPRGDASRPDNPVTGGRIEAVVEGPRHIDRHSVIAQNHYEKTDLVKLKKEVERQLQFQKGKTLPETNNTSLSA